MTKAYTQEWKDKISATLKRHYANGEIINAKKGKHLSNYTKSLISKNNGMKQPATREKLKILRLAKGITSGFKGKHHSDKIKKSISKNSYFRIINNDEKLTKKRTSALLQKPTKPEKIMIEIIKKNNLPFNYVGNGKIWFKGFKTMFNPDFLSKNPKYIIEVDGDYWHNLPNVKQKDERRIKTYFKYGYKTLIVWEHELKNKEQVINKIKGFIQNE